MPRAQRAEKSVAMPALMRVGDVARYIGVTPRTVYSWVAKGWIGGIKLGPHRTAGLRFKAQDVLRLLAQRGSGARGWKVTGKRKAQGT